jgi:hypothetical protein
VGQNAPLQANQTATIKVSTQLVVETVWVKDRKGNSIEGLAAKDFTVTENSVPQAIRFFEYEGLPRPTVPRLKLARRRKYSRLRQARPNY